ncbi:Hypothetical predicted protein [Cloeon dipterum]|uniref:Uncharacterized protein n=1 Tax=Cloeon dipterum TaxID=197152 RepID=A0A8S1D6S1_9INSE|nr:Hypothetical predicted protein [Cloeon dipterum]
MLGKEFMMLVLVVLAKTGATVSTGAAEGDKKEARDGLFMDVVDRPSGTSSSASTFSSFAEDFLQCNPTSNNIFSSSEGLGQCLRRRAVTHLLSGTASSIGVSDSISLEPAASDLASGSRALPQFQYAGAETPSLTDAMRHFLGQRIMRWQLDMLYPGLVMRVGPMGVHDSGMLEFVLERLYDDTDRSLGPGKLLVKRTVLPALLGFKLKLSTLMPILLAGFFFMASKAVFFSKLAIMTGALIGLKSVLFGGSGHHHYGPYGLHPAGHSNGESFWDSFFGGFQQQHHSNPFGPVSFKSVRAAPAPVYQPMASFQQPAASFQQPEILDPANDHVPRDLDAAGQQQRTVKDVKPLVVVAQRKDKRNFAWDTDELMQKTQQH